MNKATHVKAWLETKPSGFTFTSVEIAEALGLSHGAVTGYRARARRIRRTPAPPSFEFIQDRLLEIAEELDSVRTPLAVYTIEELLAEIATRARGDA